MKGFLGQGLVLLSENRLATLLHIRLTSLVGRVAAARVRGETPFPAPCDSSEFWWFHTKAGQS